MASCSVICLLAVALLFICSSQCAKILLVPSDHGANVNFFLVAGRALADAGHQVRLLTVDRHQKIVEKFGIQATVMKAERGRSYLETDYDKAEEVIFRGGFFEIFQLAGELVQDAVEVCQEFLEDETIMTALRSENFDLAIMDGAPAYWCQYLIPYKLGIRYASLTPHHDPWMLGVAAMPSAEATFPMMYFEGEPPFLDRLKSMVLLSVLHILVPPTAINNALIDKYAPEMPTTTFYELYLKSEIWFVNMENICLDRPRVYAPHYHFVGGINTQPAKPLPRDIEDYVKDADKGVILVSFGSAIKKLPRDIFEKMTKAFAMVEQKVIMRFDGNVSDVPPNVKLLKWLPQNDILGHRNTRLFITHAGNNGQLEALYHGVPMLAMPVGLDQKRNALRSADHGYGKTVNPFDFEAEELVETMKELVSNPKYAKSIQQCSAIFRDLPSPRNTIVFYVEHVLKFGSAHLKPVSVGMPLWKFLLLDVLAFLLICFLTLTVVSTCCIRAVYRKCCRKSVKTKKE